MDDNAECIQPIRNVQHCSSLLKVPELLNSTTVCTEQGLFKHQRQLNLTVVLAVEKQSSFKGSWFLAKVPAAEKMAKHASVNCITVFAILLHL